jgi:hypothetical protein
MEFTFSEATMKEKKNATEILSKIFNLVKMDQVPELTDEQVGLVEPLIQKEMEAEKAVLKDSFRAKLRPLRFSKKLSSYVLESIISTLEELRDELK